MEAKGKPVTDLAVVDFDIVDITDEEIIKNGLADLKKRFSEVSDPSTKEGYEENRAGVAIMRTLRGKVVANIKSKKDPLNKKRAKLISVEKWLIGDIEALENPMKEKNKAHDEKIAKDKADKARAEEERIDTIAKRIEDIRLSPITNMDNDSARLSEILLMVKDELKDVSWADEKVEQAQDVIGEAITRLEQLVTVKKSQEDMARQQEEAANKIAADKLYAEEKAHAEREEQDRKNKEDADKLAKEQAELEAEKEKFRKEQEDKEAAAKKIEDDRLAKIKKEDDERAAKIKAEDDAAKEKEDARLAAIKKEDDDRAAKFKADQDAKDAKARAKKEAGEAKKQAKIDSDNLNTRIDESIAVISNMLECGGQVDDIVNAIIDGSVPHITFT